MNENNEEQAPLSNKTVLQDPKETQSTASLSQPRQSLFCSTHFTLLITLLALILALLALYTNYHVERISARQQNVLKQKINTLEQQQKTNSQGLGTFKASLHQSEKSLETQMQGLREEMQSALKQPLYQKQDWLLLKARYYLELAQIDAHWGNSRQASIALLMQADNLLSTLSDQRLFAVRQAIAKEIAKLKALPELDIPGLLSQLDAAENALSHLPIKKPKPSSTAKNAKAETEASVSSWRETLKRNLSLLQKLVIIRHNEEDIQPLVSPLHQTLLRDSIRLNLQEAQWAIMQNSPKVYHLALTKALQEIRRVFDENADATKALMEQLQALERQKLINQNTTLDQSLPLLNQVILGGKTP